jgi:serine/threonine protein phosphatase PrpC
LETADRPVEPLQTEQPNQTAAQAPSWHGQYEGTVSPYHIAFYHDHHGSGRGEDAPPISIFKHPCGLIGVFDGVGGAGGDIIRLANGGEQTSAWFASRLVHDCVLDVYGELQDPRVLQVPPSQGAYDRQAGTPEFHEAVDLTGEVRRALEERLSAFATQISSSQGSSRLKSRLIKMLPTTMAICSYDLSSGEFMAVWAGDSRIYSIRPDEGLQQVTTDDLKSSADALENLTHDSLMSNFVSVGTDFVLNERRLPLQPFTILIAATDGCFGYMQTPLHFEHTILSTMQESTDWADWQERLESRIVRVTGDDSTLSAVAVGWLDFASCRAQYSARADWCSQRVRAYDDRYEEVTRVEQNLAQARELLRLSTRALWQEYRRTYEILAHSPTRVVPRQADASDDARHYEADERP